MRSGQDPERADQIDPETPGRNIEHRADVYRSR